MDRHLMLPIALRFSEEKLRGLLPVERLYDESRGAGGLRDVRFEFKGTNEWGLTSKVTHALAAGTGSLVIALLVIRFGRFPAGGGTKGPGGA